MPRDTWQVLPGVWLIIIKADCWIVTEVCALSSAVLVLLYTHARSTALTVFTRCVQYNTNSVKSVRKQTRINSRRPKTSAKAAFPANLLYQQVIRICMALKCIQDRSEIFDYRAFPYVFTTPIWSFNGKGCRHKYNWREAQNLGSAGAPLLRWGRG